MGDPLESIQQNIGGGNLAALNALQRYASGDREIVYLVGGPVRDSLLGRPINDLDFAVEGSAPALARRLAAELGGELVVHPRFNSATVISDGSRVDLVTTRKETYKYPGALPTVTPGSIRDDLARRDFTINALAIPLAADHLEVVDWCGGMLDLRRGVLRTLHNESFIDDPTRIFRAVRYEQRLGFNIEARTLDQLKAATGQGMIEGLSPDRLRHEVEHILQDELPALTLRRCMELGVLAAVHPSLGGLATGYVDRQDRPRVRERGSGSQQTLEYLALLVSDFSEHQGEALTRRLNMPEVWRNVVRDSIRLQGMTGDLSGKVLSPSRLVHLLESCRIEAVVALASVTDDSLISQRLHRYLAELRYVEPVLNGQDLLDMGVSAGPLVGQILDRLRDDVLDRRAVTGAEQRQLVKEALTGAIGGKDTRHG